MDLRFDMPVYHLYALSLARDGAGGSANRGFGEIAKWVGHIKDMGFGTALFSPVLKSRTHGYDVTDYFLTDDRLGPNEEFISLVRLFHENGIRVVLDSVFNHCGRDFFAFRELLNGNRDYAGWFSGVDFSRQSPMGDYFTYDTWGGHYELPKFNLRNESVIRYLLEAAKYWIEVFGIDGMRLDSANELDFSFMRSLRKLTDGLKPGFWLMGEVVNGDYGRWVNGETLHGVTNYKLYKSLISSFNDNNLYELASCVANSVPENGLPLFGFADNHDQPRLASALTDISNVAAVYAALFTLPGIPSVYYGSEFGLTGEKTDNSDAPLRPYIDISEPPVNMPWLPGYIKKLAGIYNNSGALKYGGYRQVYIEYRRPFAYERFYGDERVFTVINADDNEGFINLSKYSENFRDMLSGETVYGGSAANIRVDPHSARILAI